MSDLWPDDIEPAVTRSPISVLKEQGILLGKRTNNTVEGQVFKTSTGEWASSQDFYFVFYIAAPSINYKYRLLEIAQPVDFYPVNIKIELDVLRDLPKDMQTMTGVVRAGDEKSLEYRLKMIFATNKVRRIIQALRYQVNNVDEVPSEEIPY